MIVIVLACVYAAVAAAIYAVADRRFAHRRRLPMQWGAQGRPTWYAPRRVALISAPILGGVGFAAVSGIVLATAPADAEAPMLAALLTALCIVGLRVYVAYIRLVRRWDRTAPDEPDSIDRIRGGSGG